MKATLRIALVLVLLLVLVAVVGGLMLDRLARAAVEKGGTYALGVDTRLAGLQLGLLSGETRLRGLDVANPEGFQAEHFVHLGAGELDLPLRALTKDVVEVPLLSLSDVSLHLQRREGRTNYGVILEHLERLGSKDEGGGQAPPRGGEPQPPSREPAGGGKRFLVRKVVIADVRVDFDLLPLGGELTRAKVSIPRLELSDVGDAEGGASLAEISGAVVQALLQASLEAGGQVLSPALLADLRDSLQSLGLEQIRMEGVQAELEKLDEVLGSELGEQVDEALKDVGSSLDDLFKKKK